MRSGLGLLLSEYPLVLVDVGDDGGGGGGDGLKDLQMNDGSVRMC